MRTTQTLVIAFALLLPLSSLAAPDRGQVELMLNGIEYIPTKADLIRLGPGVDKLLREIALKPSPKRMLAGTRAITLLRLFPSKSTTSTLRQLIKKHRLVTKPGVELLNLRQALTSYAVAAGPSSLKVLEPFLAHENIDVRYDAGEAVRLSRNKAAITVLQKRQKLEQTPLVKHQLARQIELIKHAPARRPR